MVIWGILLGSTVWLQKFSWGNLALLWSPSRPCFCIFSRGFFALCVEVSLVREEMPAVRSELPRALQLPGEGLQPAGNKIQASV